MAYLVLRVGLVSRESGHPWCWPVQKRCRRTWNWHRKTFRTVSQVTLCRRRADAEIQRNAWSELRERKGRTTRRRKTTLFDVQKTDSPPHRQAAM